jgi:hypothetical protein
MLYSLTNKTTQAGRPVTSCEGTILWGFRIKITISSLHADALTLYDYKTASRIFMPVGWNIREHQTMDTVGAWGRVVTAT